MSVIELLFRGNASSAVRADREVRESMQRTERQARQTGGAFTHSERELSKLGRGAVAGSGAFSHFGRSVAFASAQFLGAYGFVHAVERALHEAQDLETQTARSRIVFGTSAKSIQDWSRTTIQSLGLAADTSLKTANAFGTMLTAMGASPARAAELSKEMTRVAAAISLARGETDPSQAVRAITVALAGRGRALRQYGIILDDANIKAEALRLGLTKTATDSSKVTIAQNRLNIATARYNDALAHHPRLSTQVVSAQTAMLSAQAALRKEVAGHAITLTNAQKAQAASNIVLREGSRFTGDYQRLLNTTAGRQRRFNEGVQNLREEIGTQMLPAFNNLLTSLNGYIASLSEGGSRHRQFVRTIEAVSGALSQMWSAIRLIGRALNAVVPIIGGWESAFRLILTAVLANKFLALASSIRGSRLAMVAFGRSTVVAGNEAAAAEVKTTRLGRVLAGLPTRLTIAILLVPQIYGPMKRFFEQQFGANFSGLDAAGDVHPTDAPTNTRRGRLANRAAGERRRGLSTAAIRSDLLQSGASMREAARAIRDTAPGGRYDARTAAPAGGGQIHWAGRTSGLASDFKNKLANAVYEANGAQAGAHVNVTSGKRSDAAHPGGEGNMGAHNSNHLYGHAADGTVTFSTGRNAGATFPLGDAPLNYSKWGLRAGRTFDWNGAPDRYHVDDGYVQRTGGARRGDTSFNPPTGASGAQGGGGTQDLTVDRKTPRGPSRGRRQRSQIAAIAASPWDAGHYGGHGQNLRGAFARVTSGQAHLSRNKMRFCELVARGTGLDIRVVEAWVLAEGGPDDNPLNIGPGRHYGSVEAAAAATIALIEGSSYYSGIRGATGGPGRGVDVVPSAPRATRRREASQIREYEQQIRDAMRAGTVTRRQGNLAIRRLETERRQLASAHMLTPQQNAAIEESVRRTWAGIHKQITAGAREARKRAAALAKAHQEAVHNAERVVDVARQRLGHAWDLMASRIGDAFDRVTQAGEQAISRTFDALTPAEQALADLEARRSQRQLDTSTADAQSALDYAKMVGDPEMIRQAQSQLDDARDAALEDSLQRQAQIERTAADQRRDAAVQEYDDLRAIQRQKLDDYLADLKTQLDNGTITWSDAIGDIKSMLASPENLGDFGNLGALIGQTFTQGLLDQLGGLAAAVDAYQAALAPLAKLGYTVDPVTGDFVPLRPVSATVGTNPRTGGQTVAHTGGLRTAMADGGIVTRPLRALIGEAGPEAVIPLAKAGALGGDTYVFHLPRYMGDRREVVDEIQTELQRRARRGVGGLRLS